MLRVASLHQPSTYVMEEASLKMSHSNMLHGSFAGENRDGYLPHEVLANRSLSVIVNSQYDIAEICGSLIPE